MGIKLKMTLWYTLLAVLTAGLMGGLLFVAAQGSAFEYYSDTLNAASVLAQSQLEYESGNLEIDDDLDDIPDVHIALYTGGGTLIYGRTRVELPFEAGSQHLQRTQVPSPLTLRGTILPNHFPRWI